MVGDQEDFVEKVESSIKYSFGISYRGTKRNKQVHERFKDFAHSEADGSYITALKILLDMSEEDWKYQVFLGSLREFDDRLRSIEASLQEEKKEEKKGSVKTFGG